MYNQYLNMCYNAFLKNEEALAKENFTKLVLPDLTLQEFINIVRYYMMTVDVFDLVAVQPENYSNITAFKRWTYNEYFDKNKNQDEFIKLWDSMLRSPIKESDSNVN